MKFPSIKTLAESAGKTVKRFPFEILFALAATIASTIKIELSDVNRVGENWCLRVMIIGNLGLLLSLAATLYAESNGLKLSRKLLLHVVGAIIALSFLFVINPGIREADFVRFFLLSLGLHLLVAFAAFTKGYNIQGFWQFNKTLFLRFLTAALYGIVLFLGLSAAIGAMNYLFNFKFEWDTFSILFTWIVGIFSTTFFLAGVPSNLVALNDDTSYPKGSKVFTQYVLIPLASVYVLILLAYEVKILIEWNLPKGSVSYLILSYAVFGILSLLLVYPVREQAENKWLKTYTRSFYFLLIPLLGLLFVAVAQRLSSYGITEPRYFLIALACWLLFITCYFLFSKKQNIKVIPISLCIVTLLSVYGPQSAFSVSMYSQRSILVDILKRNNAYKDGKLLPVKKISKADGDRASDILYYLVNHHDLTSLQPYFNIDLSAVSDSLSKQKSQWNGNFTVENYELRERKLSWASKYLGLNKYPGYFGSRYGADTATHMINYVFRKEGDIDNIKDYDYFIDAKGYNDTTTQLFGGIKFIEQKKSYSDYSLEINNEKVSFDVTNLAKKLIAAKKSFDKVKSDTSDNQYIVADNWLLLVKETAHYKVALMVRTLNANQAGKGEVNVVYADANYLIKIK